MGYISHSPQEAFGTWQSHTRDLHNRVFFNLLLWAKCCPVLITSPWFHLFLFMSVLIFSAAAIVYKLSPQVVFRWNTRSPSLVRGRWSVWSYSGRLNTDQMACFQHRLLRYFYPRSWINYMTLGNVRMRNILINTLHTGRDTIFWDRNTGKRNNKNTEGSGCILGWQWDSLRRRTSWLAILCRYL